MHELNQVTQSQVGVPKIRKAFLINNQIIGLNTDDTLIPLADLIVVAPKRRARKATAMNGEAKAAKKRGRPAKKSEAGEQAASSPNA